MKAAAEAKKKVEILEKKSQKATQVAKETEAALDQLNKAAETSKQ